MNLIIADFMKPVQVKYSVRYTINNGKEKILSSTAMINMEIIDLSKGPAEFEKSITKLIELQEHALLHITDKATLEDIIDSGIDVTIKELKPIMVGVPTFPTINNIPY